MAICRTAHMAATIQPPTAPPLLVWSTCRLRGSKRLTGAHKGRSSTWASISARFAVLQGVQAYIVKEKCINQMIGQLLPSVGHLDQ